jgi:integrase
MKRRDGRWVGQLQLEPKDGRRHRKYVYGRTRREALDKLIEVRRLVELGHDGSDERITTAAYLATWLSEVVPGTVKVTTAQGYEWTLNRYVIPHIGHVRLSRLQPAHVQRMLRTLEDQGLSARTRRQARTILRRALAHAERWQMVHRNAAALVDAPKVERTTSDALTVEEALTLMTTVQGHPLEPLVALALTTGLRRGELLALRWGAVDATQSTVAVRGTLKRQRGAGLVVDTPKTARSNRVVPVPPRVMALVQAGRPAAGSDDGYVFSTTSGTPMDPSNLTRQFHALTERAGLGRRRFHALRHSAATIMLELGVPLEVISTTLGHASYAITADIYARVRPNLQQQAAAAMNQLMPIPAGMIEVGAAAHDRGATPPDRESD